MCLRRPFYRESESPSLCLALCIGALVHTHPLAHPPHMSTHTHARPPASWPAGPPVCLPIRPSAIPLCSSSLLAHSESCTFSRLRVRLVTLSAHDVRIAWMWVLARSTARLFARLCAPSSAVAARWAFAQRARSCHCAAMS
ncbi:uncharacterized protein B0H18DRAFT_1038540 [Fomitopsis serialis]|uniref:uncharacterized protein n=1 Tax=Fomitopsis serialis TaxID=139415 RepID=UPI002008B2CC|nr:uncharacterized protein B0H18DRAFT_1038540 [Neoantrodia serialis]KAH9916313.1 hypothetical protein B0H18DRAFT_1038540 [Neoantrodia serialis]